MRQVTAYEAFAIYGDYDSNAPDTSTICLVASEDLAKEVCSKLNEDPRKYCVVFVDGWEHAKRFRFRPELVATKAKPHTTMGTILATYFDDE